MFKQEIVFGIFLKERRAVLKLTQAQLAAMVGYSNITKGIRRISAIENGDTGTDLTEKLMNCLGVSPAERQRCLDHEDNFRRQLIAKLPDFKPVLTWRAMACIYVPVEIPEDITRPQEMLAYAAELARSRHGNCCLELDYDLKYWISKNGDISKADRRIKKLPRAKPDIGILLANS